MSLIDEALACSDSPCLRGENSMRRLLPRVTIHTAGLLRPIAPCKAWWDSLQAFAPKRQRIGTPPPPRSANAPTQTCVGDEIAPFRQRDVIVLAEFEAEPEPCTSERAFLVMRGTPSIGARDWGQLARGVPPFRLHMLADLVKWAKLDKEIGAKLDREDAE